MSTPLNPITPSLVNCPAGFKTAAGACLPCEIGTYNAAEGAIECMSCGGDKTTYSTGNYDNCLTVGTWNICRELLVVEVILFCCN